jgi:hypothetical protein
MVTQELKDYIERQKQQGMEEATLRAMLLDAGWNEDDVDSALGQGGSPEGELSPAPVAFANDTSQVQEQVSPESQPQQTAPTESANTTSQVSPGNPTDGVQIVKKRKPFFRKLLIFVVFLALLAGALLGFFQFYYFAPDKVYERVAASYAEVTTFEMEGQIKVSSLGAENTVTAGEFDILSGYFPKDYTVGFKGYFEMPTKTTLAYRFDVDATTGIAPLVKGAVISTNDNLFVNIAEVVDLGMLNPYIVKEQWINIPLSDFYRTGNTSDQSSLSNEDEAELIAYLKANPPFRFTRRVTLDKENGIEVLRFAFTVDKENLINAAGKISEITRDDFDWRELEGARSYLADIEFGEGEIGVGVRDNFIYNFRLPFVLKQNGVESISFEMLLNFSNYNVKQQITEPGDAKSFDEIFGSFFDQADDLELEVDKELNELENALNEIEIPEGIEAQELNGT